MRRKTTFVGAMAFAVLSGGLVLVAQDVQEATAPPPEATARMAPGPMHAKLEPLVGSWHMNGKWRMSPDAPWQDFEASIEREWILDGRFVQETLTSEFMGQPYEGLGLLGHDNTREEFTMVWVDNLSTGTATSTGSLDGSVMTLTGENSDPMTGAENRWSKSVLDLSADVHTYTGYGKGPNGEEFVTMEATGTRK